MFLAVKKGAQFWHLSCSEIFFIEKVLEISLISETYVLFINFEQPEYNALNYSALC